jgi:copper chaperone
MKLAIEGMTCGHCVRAVTKALEKVPGAANVAVSLERREAIVDGVDVAAAVKAIEGEGYAARVAEPANGG